MAPAGGGFAVPACSCLLNRSDPRRNQGHPCSRIRGRPWAMQLLRISLQTIGYCLNHEQIIGYCLIRKRVWSKRPGSGTVLGQCSCFIITSRYIVRPDIQICFSRLRIVFLVPGIFLYKRYCSRHKSKKYDRIKYCYTCF